jgi:hypothetical protein
MSGALLQLVSQHLRKSSSSVKRIREGKQGAVSRQKELLCKRSSDVLVDIVLKWLLLTPFQCREAQLSAFTEL